MDISKIAEVVGKNTKQIVNVGSTLLSDEVTFNEESVKESQLMDAALSSDFNSKAEVNAKKVIATAMLIAKKNNVLPAGMPEIIDGVSSASIADEAISRMKVAYKIATGAIDVEEAADKLIDRATARLVAVSDTMVEKGLNIAINKIGAAIAVVYPQARPVVAVIKVFQPYLTAKVKVLVKKGIQKTNEFAKSAARKIIAKAKTVSTSIARLFL